MHEQVRAYYGETLTGSQDLQTDACCTDAGLPEYVKPLLARVHDEVLSRYYGCGLVLPEQLAGLTVLDLGCGAGRDVYVLSQLVGEQGRVIGVDMTEAQLEVATRHIDYHRQAFRHAASNVEFRHGYIERLHELALPADSVDVIVSNCVINLVPDKAAVLAEAFRVLKPGGELYFSDVYCDRRIPAELAQDPLLYGECLSGALYWNDFQRLAKAAGFVDPRRVTDRPLAINNPQIAASLGSLKFWSVTCRLFKVSGLEDGAEDYGDALTYLGSVAEHPDHLEFDTHNRFPAGQEVRVSGNTRRLIMGSRFAAHFEAVGGGAHQGVYAEADATPWPLVLPTASCCAPKGGCC